MPPGALLNTKEHGDILDVIDRLRGLGVSRYVDLPQVIVCGDQSSGKSSVLEALSGIGFPRKDNLCTRFATEVILRRSERVSIDASIVPDPEASAERAAATLGFGGKDIALDDLKSLMDEAAKMMGIDSVSKRFSNDVLRLEVQGPHQPQLTLVDLPGLFHAANKIQSEGDAEAVLGLVRSYMRKSRSIILAVVSAKNEFSNQIVTTFAKQFDPRGLRTLGVITKPDVLHVGSESEASYLEMARNKDVVFHHGWHTVRNRDFDTRDSSMAERDAAEGDFFSTGVWAGLPREHVGISALRDRLSALLRDQIVKELPGLVEDTEAQVVLCRASLALLGSPRKDEREQRQYLLSASQQFVSIVKSAVDGSYYHPFFESAMTPRGTQQRLRAVVQNALIDFASEMRRDGHARHIVDARSAALEKKHPNLISHEEMVDKVLVLMKRSRGRELPGTFNPLIIGDLFLEQSAGWHGLARRCLDDILNSVRAALDLVLHSVVDSRTEEGLKSHVVKHKLSDMVADAHAKLEEMLHPHQRYHPITYNHYFTENLQNIRSGLQEKRVLEKLDSFFNKNSKLGHTECSAEDFDTRSLAKALSEHNELDMDRFACAEMIACMRAYHKVAMKTFVDDFSTLVVERCVLQQLSGVFTAESVSALGDEMVHNIAVEPASSTQERERLSAKLSSTMNALSILREFTVHATPPADDLPKVNEEASPPSQQTIMPENETPAVHVRLGNGEVVSEEVKVACEPELSYDSDSFSTTAVFGSKKGSKKGSKMAAKKSQVSNRDSWGLNETV